MITVFDLYSLKDNRAEREADQPRDGKRHSRELKKSSVRWHRQNNRSVDQEYLKAA